ncbi:MAG: hypothetical protein HY823_04590 [Acidobacteria bacterium]|nr:hypothetical protein [Acidobacteriota bacterium]
MIFLRRLLTTLASLLLAAHGMRGGFPPLVLGGVLLAILAWIPSPWAFGCIRVGLGLGALEWLRSLVLRAQERAAIGQPWERMAMILGTVALFTAFAAWGHPRPRSSAGSGA